VLLFGSASVRLLTSGTEAFAQDSQLPTASVTSQPPAGQQTDSVSLPSASPLASTAYAANGEISGLIAALKERESRVVEREKRLEMRLRALAVADAEIEKRMQALSETEQALRATLSLADEASENDLLRLTAVYESMKPKDAAALFEEMDPNFAAGFLGRMRPDVAASVMAGLTPAAAYSISVILAGRNANAPKT
jgi:flagellar motility protein MotE (MotC chaperone)